MLVHDINASPLWLWHRLLGRPASEYGRLCHGAGCHEGGGRCRRVFLVPILVRQTSDHKEGVQAFKDKRPPKFTGR